MGYRSKLGATYVNRTIETLQIVIAFAFMAACTPESESEFPTRNARFSQCEEFGSEGYRACYGPGWKDVERQVESTFNVYYVSIEQKTSDNSLRQLYEQEFPAEEVSRQLLRYSPRNGVRIDEELGLVSFLLGVRTHDVLLSDVLPEERPPAPEVGDWDPGAVWVYRSGDDRYDLNVTLVHVAEHPQKGPVFVVATKVRDGAEPTVADLPGCITITKRALVDDLRQRAGNAYPEDFDYCIDNSWREAWDADSLAIFETSIGEALDYVAQVIARSAPNDATERTPDE
jgi:hypothetical protein